jgi:hypothetical protein
VSPSAVGGTDTSLREVRVVRALRVDDEDVWLRGMKGIVGPCLS